MNTRTLVGEEELLEECGFWKKYTGEVREPASSTLAGIFWLIRAYLRAALIFIRELRSSRTPHQEPKSECELLFVYLTNNQHRAFRAWSDTRQAGIQYASPTSDSDWRIPWSRCATLSLKYLWPTYRLLERRADSAETLPWIEEFVRYQAGSILAKELYDKARPSVVGFSNDHSGIFRAFIRVARLRGCKLVYTQHGSIGKGFPRLEFDLSLLDGVQAYSQYCESGKPDGEIVITGRVRHRLAHTPPPISESQYIGLATNNDDSLLDWMRLIRQIRSSGRKIMMRCHPAELRVFAWKVVCRLSGIEMAKGSLEDFINKSDVLICGMSGVILDAAIYGVPSLVKLSPGMTSPRMLDYYGFEQFGLSRRIESLDDLSLLLAETKGRRLDPMQVGAFEAGLLIDPEEEKRAAVSIFLERIKQGDKSSLGFEARYIRISHSSAGFWTARPYADAIAEHVWLTDSAVM